MFHGGDDTGRLLDLQAGGETSLRLEEGSGSLKPPRFSYEAPETTQEVVQLLERHGGEAKILAGGQSLVPLLSFRIVRPQVLVDINRVTGLDYLRQEGDGVEMGPLVRHRTVELDPELGSRCPMIRDALSVLGHVAIRNRGTVAGSLAHADPAGEWPAVALALDAEFTLIGPAGVRRVPAEEFFLGFMSTAIQPDEMLSEVRLRLHPREAGSSFVELARRHGDYAQAGAGAILAVSREGEVTHARVTMLGLGVTPLRAVGAEDALMGERPNDGLFKRAADLAGAAMEPLDDVHASAGYKRQVGVVMVRRALETAHRRAGRDL